MKETAQQDLKEKDLVAIETWNTGEYERRKNGKVTSVLDTYAQDIISKCKDKYRRVRVGQRTRMAGTRYVKKGEMDIGDQKTSAPKTTMMCRQS